MSNKSNHFFTDRELEFTAFLLIIVEQMWAKCREHLSRFEMDSEKIGSTLLNLGQNVFRQSRLRPKMLDDEKAF